MKVVTVCGMGFGTSLMLLMSVKESGRKYGITVEGEATDLGSYKGKKLRFDCGIVRDCKTDRSRCSGVGNYKSLR